LDSMKQTQTQKKMDTKIFNNVMSKGLFFFRKGNWRLEM
jgi:hypothetical protein